MYRRMLIPLDGSVLAEVVLTYARELAGRLDIDLTLLHISSPAANSIIPMQQAYVQHTAEALQKQVRNIQKDSGLKPKGRLVKAKGELVEGYPAEEILRYAEENDIDLILLATHGRSGLKRWSIGSVAGKVLGASKIPVWLIPTGIPEEITYDQWSGITLLVPLDGSELAESVLSHVEVIAGQRSKEKINVVLLRISEPPAMPTYFGTDISGVTIDWGDYARQETIRRKNSAEKYLDKVEKKLKERNISAAAKVIEGKANDEIVDYANKNPHSIVIMATHGRSGLSRLVYGSVAANLLHGISSPVLLIKP
ncbi:universal stress protein [Chloroflexota bacterium]